MPINPHKIQQIIGERHELLSEMLRLFAKDLQEHGQLLQALQQQAAPRMNYQRLLHRLMGSASYFAAEDLRSALVEAERLCHEASAPAVFDAALGNVYGEIQRILSCELMQQALH
jgi:HPt (histidine-containing phosphotransfer) domain-containing protein